MPKPFLHSTVVEYSPHYPKVKRSSHAAVGTWGENGKANLIFLYLLVYLSFYPGDVRTGWPSYQMLRSREGFWPYSKIFDL